MGKHSQKSSKSGISAPNLYLEGPVAQDQITSRCWFWLQEISEDFNFRKLVKFDDFLQQLITWIQYFANYPQHFLDVQYTFQPNPVKAVTV